MGGPVSRAPHGKVCGERGRPRRGALDPPHPRKPGLPPATSQGTELGGPAGARAPGGQLCLLKGEVACPTKLLFQQALSRQRTGRGALGLGSLWTVRAGEQTSREECEIQDEQLVALEQVG